MDHAAGPQTARAQARVRAAAVGGPLQDLEGHPAVESATVHRDVRTLIDSMGRIGTVEIVVLHGDVLQDLDPVATLRAAAPDVLLAAMLPDPGAGGVDIRPEVLLDNGIDEVFHDDLNRPARLRMIVNRAVERSVQRRTVAQLQRVSQQLERFAYSASHDLKEPLRAISGFSRLLSDRYAGQLDENADTYLAFITGGASRLGDMINGLLQFSRLSRHEIEPEEVDLDQLVAGVLADLAPRVRASGAKVAVQPLPTLVTDARLMRTVIHELLANAVTFVVEGRPLLVEVAASPTADGWQIEVTDTGVGIAASDQQRIFDIFATLHIRENYPGNGMGLALVAMAIPRLQGTIEVSSEPGRGTTMTVSFPSILSTDPSG